MRSLEENKKENNFLNKGEEQILNQVKQGQAVFNTETILTEFEEVPDNYKTWERWNEIIDYLFGKGEIERIKNENIDGYTFI